MKGSQILSKILVDNYWNLVGHKSGLMSDKDYIKLDLLNRNIVVFNDDGELLAFDNICPHRGTKFFSEDSGNTVSTTIPLGLLKDCNRFNSGDKIVLMGFGVG